MLARVEVFRESSIVHLRVPDALKDGGTAWQFDFTWNVGQDWIAAMLVFHLRRVFQALTDEETKKHAETQVRWYQAGWRDKAAKKAKMY